MRHASRNSSCERGFTLVEILLAMTLTVLLMVAASQLLTSMKRSSDRMRFNSDARQRAQRALDYMTFQLRGIGDMNVNAGNPAAILTWYQRGSTTVQACYNNVTNSNLADIGTDIITVAIPNANIDVPVIKWPGSANTGANAWWNFGQLCPDGQANLDLFKELTGEHGGKSDPILISDNQGFTFYQITNYLDAWNVGQGCSKNPPEIHVVANPGQSNMLNPPAGFPGVTDPHMHLGVKYYAFRVRNGWLEQKRGMFNPSTDNPGTDFIRLLPNIEDFQIAWIFADGSIWNTASQTLPSGSFPGSVPTLAGATSSPQDVLNVRGFRVSFVGRSSRALPQNTSTTFRRPAVEDHAQGSPDRFYHQRATSVVMIRNRNLRN